MDMMKSMRDKFKNSGIGIKTGRCIEKHDKNKKLIEKA